MNRAMVCRYKNALWNRANKHQAPTFELDANIRNMAIRLLDLTAHWIRLRHPDFNYVAPPRPPPQAQPPPPQQEQVVDCDPEPQAKRSRLSGSAGASTRYYWRGLAFGCQS